MEFALAILVVLVIISLMHLPLMTGDYKCQNNISDDCYRLSVDMHKRTCGQKPVNARAMARRLRRVMHGRRFEGMCKGCLRYSNRLQQCRNCPKPRCESRSCMYRGRIGSLRRALVGGSYTKDRNVCSMCLDGCYVCADCSLCQRG